MAVIDTHMQIIPVLSSSNVGTAGKRSDTQQASSPPVSAKQEVQQNTEPKLTTQEAVQEAIQQANSAVSSSNVGISFGYEEKLGQLFVQVMDKDSGEVIREIPSREFIQHRIFMKEMVGLLLDKLA